MRLTTTARFSRAYNKLPKIIQLKVKKTLKMLVMDQAHPGLRVKRIRGTADVYEARVDKNYRISFNKENNTFILRNVDSHDKALGNP